jgi:protocatechuate 3,4-dioxygenase beta subunit
VSDARVVLRPGDREERTDEDGASTFRGVGPGMHVVHVEARGFGAADTLVEVPTTATSASERIALQPGAPVGGTVTDQNGKPIEGAKVTARDASSFLSLGDARDGAITDAKGRFRIAAVARGTYRFAASHEAYANASSEPIELDGSSERTDIALQLDSGVTVAGTVLDGAGRPAAFATVRLGASQSARSVSFEGVRQTTTDEQGAFELKALQRTSIIAVATGEGTSSPGVELDLATRGDVRDLVLRLELDGAIEGVVVDDKGEPVAEAQVIALPDVLAGGSLSELGVRGPASAATDGAGTFRLTGLPEGAFRLRATRGDRPRRDVFIEPGVAAKTGDRNVKLVLRAPGVLEGRVVLSTGNAPKAFTIAVGARSPHPVSSRDGSFSLVGVTAGSYDVAITGDEFTEKILRDVEVTGGTTKDLGTITVVRGRSLVGRVVDTNGAPVEGAEVVYARQQLISDGKKLGGSLGALFDNRLGLKRATTDGSGNFRVRGIAAHKSVAAAEHAERGRSMPVDIPAGTDDFTAALVLLPFGALEGTVKIGEEPVGRAQVIASPISAATPITVQVGGGGAYAMPRLAAGKYKITAMIPSGGGLGATSASRQVSVAAGKTTTLDIELTLGDITLQVLVSGEGDATIDAAQVFLFDAGVTYANGAELNAGFMGGGDDQDQRMGFQLGDKAAEFAQLEPGKYSVCIIPINGDMNDPKFMQRLQRNVATLPVHCKPVTVAASPETQTFETKVPPMPPLPEPPAEGPGPGPEASE